MCKDETNCCVDSLCTVLKNHLSCGFVRGQSTHQYLVFKTNINYKKPYSSEMVFPLKNITVNQLFKMIPYSEKKGRTRLGEISVLSALWRTLFTCEVKRSTTAFVPLPPMLNSHQQTLPFFFPVHLWKISINKFTVGIIQWKKGNLLKECAVRECQNYSVFWSLRYQPIHLAHSSKEAFNR